ncbi:MAG: hypothetical protein ACRD1D_13045 [Acidimicrobiales bacterium]
MADDYPSLEGKDRIPQDVLSIGFHLVQGEELSASYARYAEDAKEVELAAFFRELEATYRTVRAEGTEKLRSMSSFRPEWIEWWCRPPW